MDSLLPSRWHFNRLLGLGFEAPLSHPVAYCPSPQRLCATTHTPYSVPPCSYGAWWLGWAITGSLTAAGVYPPPAHDGEKMMLALWGAARAGVGAGGLRWVLAAHLVPANRSITACSLLHAVSLAGILTFFFFCASLTVNLMLQARADWQGSLLPRPGLHRVRDLCCSVLLILHQQAACMAVAAAAAAAPLLLSSAVHTQPGHTFASAQSLFLLLSIVFFLLAGGVSNPHAHKVGAGCSSTHKWAA